ncbi:MAG TPA: aspartate kinase [Gammaproteobacteria bacterium]|nr:aspartate kinase [Gammaproteobacteria bacterium]
MARYIMKFGGSSVASVDHIRAVAAVIGRKRREGHQVAVVLSAMGDTTDELLAKAHAISTRPSPRELDMLLSSGEQVSIALMAMALKELGLPARSWLGHQVRIRTDAVHCKARIEEVETGRLEADLAAGVIPVVAGFQGIDADGQVTTLGRGGSDTTGVALAAALKADECQILTDVDGVYTTDPRMVPQARRLSRVTFEEMLELASLGSRVLQIRSVQFAGKYNVPVRVLHNSGEGEGTLISYEEPDMEAPVVSGIAFSRDEAQVTITGVPDKPGNGYAILNGVSEAHIVVDMIVMNAPRSGVVDFSFSVPRDEFEQAMELTRAAAAEIGAGDVLGSPNVAKISVVGVGMRSHAGVATTMFEVLAREGINVRMVSTSEIKISVLIDEKYLELGVRSLHEAFGLDREPHPAK